MKWLTVGVLFCATPAYAETCIMSVYSKAEQGSATASGIPLRDEALTMAHKTYKLKGFMKVTNRKTGKVVTLQVIDRGPYIVGRCVDATPGAARALGASAMSLTPVTVEPADVAGR